MEAKQGYLFGALSGGERQRVLLGQALIPEPGLLILDEPATGLDRTGSIVMRSLLEKLKAKGATILMIHHDLAEVKELADQVTCLNQNLVFTGKPAEELTPQRVMRVFSCKQAA
jgi:zinc transport system ATP-binding protein